VGLLGILPFFVAILVKSVFTSVSQREGFSEGSALVHFPEKLTSKQSVLA
jgi:hypothetical protein